MSELSSTFTDKLFADFQADSKLRAVENAVTHNGLLKSLETRQSEMENDHAFSIDLTKDKVANQKASGRCWMFAALNTFRHKMISDLNLEDFELSQAHTFFWDKYEKSNWFLEQLIATADQELGSRKVKFLLDVPQQDGGQWDMVVALFEKYGVVPKVAYPESISSSNSRELNQYLNKLLRQDAQILREAIAAGADEKAVQAKKEELKNKKNDFFEQIILEIKQLIKSENVLSFEDDRNEWYNMFTEMLSHLIFNTYYINSIDDLCLNLTGVNVCYDKSFIKMFEILYKESFADIPHELWSKYKPHISYIDKELKLDIKCNKYINSFNKYFHKIYDETYKHTAEKLYQNEILKVHVSDEVYELLSDIVFNLYVNIAKKIACNQLTYAYFGKSTRIQFIQMFQALMDCSPRLYVFTKSQRMVLHYILLSKKVINDSIKNSLNTPDENE